LSMQTQETQVQQWVRGPRSVIGVDHKNRPFIAVFSGRTKESAGGRFDEMNSFLKTTIPNIKDAINLDGGASACLGMIYKGEFFELSLPCCTAFTTTGMARPVNSFLLIEAGH
ncbi:MAG: phosphodiester glycosidase family protein, partial [Thermotogota bacterium]